MFMPSSHLYVPLCSLAVTIFSLVNLIKEWVYGIITTRDVFVNLNLGYRNPWVTLNISRKAA